MTLLRQRLRRCGYEVLQFRYRTVHAGLEQNAAGLQQLLSSTSNDTVHLVGHSLGGLVIRRLLSDFPQQPHGRIVTLGTPHQGSYTALRLGKNILCRRLMGESLSALTDQLPAWQGERELGSLAGRLALGFGWLVPSLPRPNDGTVTVEETKLAGMADHCVLNVSHMGMLLSARVARQVCHFLKHGRFE